MRTLAVIFTTLVAPALGESRSSANFELIQEQSVAGSGGLCSSSNFELEFTSTSGGEAGSANFTLRSGFAGQLANPLALELSITPDPPSESSAVQLGADLRYDDGTLETGVAASWSPLFGPVRSIQPDGSAVTIAVYQDTNSSAVAQFGGLGGVLATTVIDTDDDNFESYGADGLPDGWQVDHFGLPPNADAGPGENPDADPHDNEFEFLTGYDPNDGSDFFRFRITSAEPGSASFEFSKFIPGTRYRLFRGEHPAGPFKLPLLDTTVAKELQDVPFEDAAAPDGRAFYQVDVEAD